jgi:formiminotetrahydrofolate cyclodeaminase
VKRHPHLQPLSDDHHEALVLARRIGLAAKEDPEQNALTQTWNDLRQRFARELEPHFRVEEEWLFRQLESAGEHALVARAWADHVELRDLVRAEADPVVARRFAELLHRHVRFEERQLFPRAESLLPLPSLEAAGHAALRARDASQIANRETAHGSAQKAAVSAVRTRTLDAFAEHALQADPESSTKAPAAAETLRDITLRLARQFARPGPPAAGSAAAATGAIAAGLLEWSAGLSALRGPEGFRKRARSIATRGATLQSSLSTAAQTDAELVGRWMRVPDEVQSARPSEPARIPDALAAATDSVLDIAARCAQVTTLAAEVADKGYGAARHDAATALRIASSAAECALALTEENLRSVVEADWTRSMQRRIWRIRLLLDRARLLASPMTLP